jgi:hypothetical protein
MHRRKECAYRAELGIETLVWTWGRSFPISRLETRLRCPNVRVAGGGAAVLGPARDRDRKNREVFRCGATGGRLPFRPIGWDLSCRPIHSQPFSRPS